jgi:surfeit locus 1 family protein
LGQPRGPVLVTGLLRIGEPHGGFLRRNDPKDGRWYSRDVAAIAAARGLSPRLTAPYFIDADATPNPGGLPVGGLTVIAFPNSHLVYALTWYGLALLVGVGFAYAAREEWSIRGGARAR